MSSPSSRRPDFRLNFGHPSLTLTKEGQSEPIDEVDLADPALGARLRAIGGTVARVKGRLTVVLPETEVWRGALDLTGRTPPARGAEARAAVAARLSVLPGALATVLGPRDSAGRTPVAAVRQSTLADTRAFLRQGGLRPAAIIGAGDFPGFAAPPRLGAPVWRDVTRGYAPRPRALGFAAACLALAFAVALPSAPPVPPPAPVMALPAPAAMTAPPAAPPSFTQVTPPRPRPAALARLAGPVQAPSPATLARPKEPAIAPVISQATRNMPELAGLKLTDDLSDARVAERILPRGTLTDTAPPRRPGSAVAAAPRAEARPLPRPGTAPAPAASNATPAAPDTAATDPSARPRARPLAPATLSAAITGAVNQVTAEPVRLAALTVTATDADTLAAAAPPEPRPARPAPVAQPARMAKPVRAVQPAQAAPARTAAPVAAAQPRIVRVAAPQPARALAAPTPTRQASLEPPRKSAPAPVRQGGLQPQPQRQVAKAAPAQPARTVTTRPAVEKSGLSRGSISLLGVFGAQGAHHALLRLPNGTVKRVRAGDSVQGARIAAVDADSVRLTGGGRDTLLKME